jgi:hypothetical protein
VYSAITIQSFARGMIVREQTRRQEHAAVLIQRTWWNFVDSWRMNWAATTIQRLWRGFNARIDFERKLIEEEEAFEQAATIIQGAWRGFAAQVEFQLDLLDIISVQNLARKKIATRRRNDIVRSVALRRNSRKEMLPLHANALSVAGFRVANFLIGSKGTSVQPLFKVIGDATLKEWPSVFC